jgi:hypothetical protein
MSQAMLQWDGRPLVDGAAGLRQNGLFALPPQERAPALLHKLESPDIGSIVAR